MLESIAIERYEQLLLGKQRISLNGSQQEKEQAARDIIHYAVAELLEWTPEETEDHMTKEIAHGLQLDYIFKYIHFPADIDPTRDYDYLAHLAYPKHPYNVEKQIKKVYRRILNGEEERFPKKIFEGARGREKGAILLQDFITQKIPYTSIDDLYETFSNMPRINNKFRQAKIYSAARKLYPTPLDYLHNSLTPEEQDEFLYAFYQYKTIAKIAEAALKKEGKFDDFAS